MLNADPALLQALREHHVGGVRAQAFYLGKPTADVTLAPGASLRFSGDAEVQATGSVTAVGQAPSLVPRAKTDPLATYGQELAIWRTVETTVGSWEIPLGRYRITDAGPSQEYMETYNGELHVRAWEVGLKLSDRFEAIRADDFLEAESPRIGNSVWAEIQRLSRFPVQRKGGDTTVPAATVYDSRLGAIRTLAGLLNGAPHLTREGVLTIRDKDAWMTQTWVDFDIPGVIDWDESMSNDFYNQVQATSSNNNQLVAFARITDLSNPLAIGNAGGRTLKYSSPVLDTPQAVQEAAQTILTRVSTRRSRIVTVTAGPEALLLELGDFGWVRDPRTGRAALGEVTSMSVPLSGVEGVEIALIVAEES